MPLADIAENVARIAAEQNQTDRTVFSDEFHLIMLDGFVLKISARHSLPWAIDSGSASKAALSDA